MTIMSWAKLALASFCSLALVHAAPDKLPEEKELEIINFKSIKHVLQKDGLSEAARKKEAEVKVLKKEQVNVEKGRYNYPSESELWGFASEYWLVKNAQILGWDFQKPDYGLDK